MDRHVSKHLCVYHTILFVAFISVFLFACGGGGGGGSTGSEGTADTTPPSVVSTSPASGATGVATNSSITVTFSEPVDSSTINASTFSVNNGSSNISGSVSCSGGTAIFKPTTSLSITTLHTVTITTGVKDVAGNALSANYNCSFTTSSVADATPPTVASTNPANNQTGVAINGSISATFSEAINPSTIKATTFTLQAGSTSVTGTVALTGNTATFTPSTALSSNTTYAATITTGVMDIAGNALSANHNWSFTTASVADTTHPTVTSTNPGNNQTGVATNSSISATFSEAMSPSTINTTTFKIESTSVSGTVALTGNTATFTPSTALSWATHHTVTITTDVKDVAGNALSKNYIWSFTTGSAPPGIFTKLFGSTGDDRANGVVTDKNGNIYIVGEINGHFTASAHGWDYGAKAFISKYDSNFNLLWSRQEGLAGMNVGKGVVLDSNGNVFITGYVSNDNSGTYYRDHFFISKYDNNGNKLWGHVSDIGAAALSIALDNNQNVYIFGAADGKLSPVAGDHGEFLFKYDTNGNLIWGIRPGVGTDSSREGASMALDTNNNIYVAGNGGDSYTQIGTTNLIKIDINGNFIWYVESTVHSGYVRSVTVDKNGNIYVVSDKFYTVPFHLGDGFMIVKYDSNGTILWSRNVGGGEYGKTLTKTYAYGATIDDNNNIYITGGTDGNVVTGTTTSYGKYDIFILKYDSNGNLLWGLEKEAWNPFAKSITIDNNGFLYIVGSTRDSIDNVAELGGPGGYDCFILKYDLNGVQQ